MRGWLGGVRGVSGVGEAPLPLESASAAYFGGLPVLVFYQLPPVKGSPVYNANSSIKGILSLAFRRKFKMVELIEVVI